MLILCKCCRLFSLQYYRKSGENYTTDRQKDGT